MGSSVWRGAFVVLVAAAAGCGSEGSILLGWPVDSDDLPSADSGKVKGPGATKGPPGVDGSVDSGVDAGDPSDVLVPALEAANDDALVGVDVAPDRPNVGNDGGAPDSGSASDCSVRDCAAGFDQCAAACSQQDGDSTACVDACYCAKADCMHEDHCG